MVCKYTKGKTLDKALKITTKRIIKYLGLPKYKWHCTEMAVEALRMAIRRYRKDE